MDKETRGITTKLIIEYVRRTGGEGAVQELIAQTGEGLDEGYLCDERSWISFDQKVRMFEAAKQILGDPDVPYHIGQSIAHGEAGSAIKVGLKMLKNSSAVFRAIPELVASFGSASSIEIIRSNANEGVLRYYVSPHVTPHISDCQYNRGLFSAIPMLFGRGPAHVEHTACAVKGEAPYCEYRISWRPRIRPDWLLTGIGAATGMLVYQISGLPGGPHLDLGLLIQPLIGAFSGFVLGHLVEDRKRKIAGNELMRRQNDLLKRTNQQLFDDLETAYQVQKTLLPSHTPKVRGLDVAGRLFYARRIGGDFYDYIPKGDRLGVCVADVCGKGIQAALFTSVLKNAMWQGMFSSSRPKKLLAYVDQQVNSQLPGDMFITMACAVADVTRDRLVISSAGHEPAILYNAAQKKAEALDVRGIALGLLPMAQVGTDLLDERECDFVEGDVLMLYTDGVFGRVSDPEAAREDLCRMLEECAHLPAEGIVNELFAKILNHTHPSKRDDLTLVVIKRTPTRGAIAMSEKR